MGRQDTRKNLANIPIIRTCQPNYFLIIPYQGQKKLFLKKN